MAQTTVIRRLGWFLSLPHAVGAGIVVKAPPLFRAREGTGRGLSPFFMQLPMCGSMVVVRSLSVIIIVSSKERKKTPWPFLRGQSLSHLVLWWQRRPYMY